MSNVATPPGPGKAPTVEKCKNCGSPIGELETPFVWREQIVCGPCYGRLSTAAAAAPIPYASKKERIVPPPLDAEADPGRAARPDLRRPGRRAIIVAALALACAAAAITAFLLLRTPDPTFRGMPRSHWLARARDKDEKTRIEAYEALGEFDGRDEGVRAALREGMSRDFGEARWVAAKAYWLKTGDNSAVIDSVRKWLKSMEAINTCSMPAPLKDLVLLLGPAAKPLLPDLQHYNASTPREEFNKDEHDEVGRLAYQLHD